MMIYKTTKSYNTNFLGGAVHHDTETGTGGGFDRKQSLRRILQGPCQSDSKETGHKL